MAPAKSSMAIKAEPARPASTSDDNVQGSSQPQDVNATLQKFAEGMQKQKEESRARRQQREREIDQFRKQRIDKVQKKMKECRQQHQEALRESRRPQVDRLGELLAEKRDIESKLQQCHARKYQAFESMVEQYQYAITGRLENELKSE